MDVCSRARPNLLLAGGTGLARRGTGDGIFSSGSLQVKSSIVGAGPAPSSVCSIGLGGPGRVPEGFQLWSLPRAALPVPTLVPPAPLCQHRGRAEGKVPGFPVPSCHRALLQGCSAPSRPSPALAAANASSEQGTPSLRGCPSLRTLRLLGSLSGRIPLPRVAEARVSAEPGGDGVIRDAPQGMHRARDTGSNRTCCYQQRLQLQRLPQPTGTRSLCGGIGALSLLDSPPPFPAGFTEC